MGWTILACLLAAPAAWADAGKDAAYQEMGELAGRIGALKPQVASNVSASVEFDAAMARYTDLSGSLGGDDPGRILRAEQPGDRSPGQLPAGGLPAGCLASTSSFMISPGSTVTTGSPVSSVLAVAGAGSYVIGIELTLNLPHTFAADLDITLTSPSGTTVVVTTDNGAGNDNVFAGSLFADYAGTPVTDFPYANNVVATPMVAEGAFGAYIGENPNGNWTLSVVDDAGGDDGTLVSWSLSVTTLSAAPTITTVPNVSISPGTNITTGSPFSSMLNVAGAGTAIFDVNLNTNMPHTFAADLDVSLTSPAGTVVTITTDNGAGNDNVFAGSVFDDDAALPVSDFPHVNNVASSPMQPEEAMAALFGQDPNGVWSLNITDDAGGDDGTLVSWSLDIQTFSCVAGGTTADLSITKTDGVTTAVPGGSTTYTITASNAGPDPVTGASVTDFAPFFCDSFNWTCVGAGGGSCAASGSGDIGDATVNLPVGGSVSYTAICGISNMAAGMLSNTASINPPGGVTDPNLANNTATDTDTLTPQADLAITKTDGVTTAVPGGSTTYTITASNAGPSNTTATVADTFPASLTCSWTCVGAGGGLCTAAGAGNINDPVTLPAGGSVTYTASCSISPAATGMLSNTATVTGAATDPVPGNNSATDVDTLTPQADLAITKTDGVTSVSPGGMLTYTITASNAGASNAPGATVTDTFPASLTCSWTCVAAGGGICTAAGMGNINDVVNLPVGGSVTYTASCAVSAAATGSIVNTATVAAPAGVTDPVPGNNSATDTDTVLDQADLAITKTDGVASAVPGNSVTYTITGSNAGPAPAMGATVVDNFPATLSCNWTCVGAGGGTCTAAGMGNINDAVNLPAGGSVTYTASCAIASSATGNLVNTATISGPAPDPNPANNSATDTDTLTPQADVSVTKTDGVTTAVPGQSVTYTIVASNSGPSDAPTAPFVDSFPPSLSCSYSSVAAGGASGNTAAGSGSINEILSLPAGASVTYTAVCNIDPAATGILSNSALITSANDTNPANNSATDSDTLVPNHDLSITKTDGVTNAIPGQSVTWTIVASNAGPSNAVGAAVNDSFPAACTSVSWTCVGAGGGTCAASGSGNIADTVNLPVGGTATYSATCNISAAATGNLVNTATIAAAAGSTDPNAGNNSATDTDTLVPNHDLSITKTDGVTSAIPGQSVTYTIVASNGGPSDAVGATVSDSFPAACTSVTWTCVGAGGGTCAANGSGNIADTINLPVGGTATYSAICTIDPAATGNLVNTATVTVAAGSTDPNAANNSATDTDTLNPSADLSITKIDQGVPVPTLIGSSFSYLLTASNAGPSTATSVVVTDSLPSTLSYVSNSCGASFAAPTLTWNIGTLAPATNATCTINVTVATLGTISNTASLTSATADPTPGNNAATNTLTGAQAVDVAISLTADAGAGLAVGDSYTYTVTGTNLGVGLAGGLDFTLSLSGKVSFVSSTCGAVLAGNTLSWSVATLADGASTSCQITVVVVLAGDIQATANVATATFDPNLANNSADLAVAVAAIPIPALDRIGLLLLMLLSAGLGMAMVGRVRSV